MLSDLILPPLRRLRARANNIADAGSLRARMASAGKDVRASLPSRDDGVSRAFNSPPQAMESEKTYRAIVQAMPDGIFLLDVETGRLLEANPAFQKMVGYTAKELLHLSLCDLVPSEPCTVDENVMRLLADKQQEFGEHKLRQKGGSLIEAEIATSLIVYNNKQVACVVARDVTRRKWAEDAARRNEAYFRALIENALDVIGILNVDGTVCYLSSGIERMLGFSCERLTGRSAFDMIHKDDAAGVKTIFADALQNPGLAASAEFRLQHQDGEWVTVEATAHSMLDDPAVMGIIFSMRDVSARKQAEERLREGEERYRQEVENSPNAIFRVNRKGIVQTWNRACETVLKYGQDIVGKDLSQILLEATDRPRLASMIEQVFEKQSFANIEVSYRCQDGAARFMTSRLFPVLNRAGEVEVCVFANTDITESKNARAETERRAKEFEALFRTAQELATQPDLPALLESIIDGACALLSASSGGIYLYDAASGNLEMTVARGWDNLVGMSLKLGEGMAGRVAETRQPLIVDDYRTWQHRSPKYEGLPIRAVVQMPMLWRGELVGVLTVNEVGDTTRKFSEADARLLSLFAMQAASAVHNAHLLQETRRRADRLVLLNHIASALSQTLDLDELLEVIYREISAALQADAFFIALYDGATDELNYRIRVDEGVRDAPERRRLGPGLTAHVIRGKKSLLIRDWEEEKANYPPVPVWGSMKMARASLYIPLLFQGDVLGVISVQSYQANTYGEEEERLLATIADQAAVAVEKARLFAETEHRLQRLHALSDIDKAISSSLDLRVTLEVVLDQVTNQLHVDAADVLLHNPGTQTLTYAAGRGFRSRALQFTELRLGEGLAGTAALEHRMVHFPNLMQDMDGLRRSPLLANEAFIAYFAVPLMAKGQIKGVLEIFHRAPLEPDQEWLEFAQALGSQAAIAIDDAELFDGLQRSNVELTLAYDATIEGWSHALELRDQETQGHAARVTDLTLRLARCMGMREQELVHLRHGALLHDIGKMAIPDDILFKPGPLSADEWEIMRRHPTYAYEMLSPIAYLHRALEVPYCHHEKWDGSGYPRGLKGEQIPLSARIFAVVDVWDALRSDRPYRTAWGQEQVYQHIRDQAGVHFDPAVVEEFLRMDTWAK